MKPLVRLLSAAALTLSSNIAFAQAPASQEDYTPSPQNMEAREWFQNAKFGVFLHWGLYSQLGGTGSPKLAEWVMEDLKISAAQYERLAQFFNPTGFNADEWVKSIKDSGAQYIVITAKHHDGFAMYDSKVSSYNIVQSTPFKRDPMKELAAACQRHGIKLFFYYSQLDWHHPDYWPRGRTGHGAGRPYSGDWNKYLDYQDAQLKELLTQYGPIGGIWFDGWWDHKKTATRDKWNLSRTYKMIHELQPSALIQNNHHELPFPGEDYQGFERDLPGQNTMGFNTMQVGQLPIEMSDTMNSSWGFSLTDTGYKTPKELVHRLVRAAGFGANYLLNTGPMPNGKIQPENLATFAEIGKWLDAHGKGIYNTRGGPITPRSWGVTTQSRTSVFVHILDWKEAALEIPLQRRVTSAVHLASGKSVKFTQNAGIVRIEDAAPVEGEWDRVIELKVQ